MAIDYSGCACGGAGTGAGCCAPSTSTEPFCLDDGSTIVAVYQTPCGGCADAANPPVLTGYMDPVNGAFTPGPLPAGAGPCSQVADCDSPTTPTTTIGLCLADGTPIGVLMTRNCAGVFTRDGWINLTTGAFTAGAPPAGTVACGGSQSVQVSGTFCDVDQTTGDVLGLVLIEYTYGADGSISSVRLVDATTGATYTPQGEITTCPTGVEQPEQDVVQLCDMQAGGVSVPMIRDYRRDENGAIVGYTDYQLDGTPYIPTGTVGRCTDQCRQIVTEQLCDSTPKPVTDIDTVNSSPQRIHNNVTGVQWATPVDGTPLWNGGSVVLPESAQTSANGYFRATAAIVSIDPICCPSETTMVTMSARIRNDGPDPGQGSVGGLYLYNKTTEVRVQGATANTGVGNSEVLTLGPVAVPTEDLVAGNILFAVALEVSQNTTRRSWTVDQYTVTAVPAAMAGCGNTFQRLSVLDCETGAVITTINRDLNGAPYTPVGAVAPCIECDGPTCLECDTVQLCDVQKRVSAVLPSVGAATESWQNLANGVQWMRRGSDGAVPSGWYIADATAPERFDFSQPVGISYSVRFTSATSSPMRIPAGWYLDAINTGQHTWDPVTRIIAPTASVTTAGESVFRLDAPAGDVMFAPTLTATQPSGVSSQYGKITVTADQSTQFLRTICRGCDGQVVSSTDTALDGVTQYVPVGTVGRCPEDPAREPCAKQLIERCGCDDTTGDGIGDVTYTEVWALDPCNGAAPELVGTYRDGDFTQPYAPVSPVECSAVEDDLRFDVEIQGVCSFNATGDMVNPGLTQVRVFDKATGNFVRSYVLDATGAPYTIPAGFTVAPCDAPATRDYPVQTGARRMINSTANQNLKTEFPGLQSVSLTVLSGTVMVHPTDGSGTVIPAGVTMTWSVSDTDDSSLAAASFTGATVSDYILNWTRKTGSEGVA